MTMISPTPGYSSPVMEPLATSTATYGSRAVSTVITICFPSKHSAVVNMLAVDVINVSGHRLSTAEIESALIMHRGVAETAGTLLPANQDF
jgi:hypothetical protein